LSISFNEFKSEKSWQRLNRNQGCLCQWHRQEYYFVEVVQSNYLGWNLKRSWQKWKGWQKWQSWQKWRIGQNSTEIRNLVVGDAVTSIFCKSCQTVLLDLG